MKIAAALLFSSLALLSCTRRVLPEAQPLSAEPALGAVEQTTEPAPRVIEAKAQPSLPGEERRRHACLSEEDGSGGFIVTCRVSAISAAVNVTNEDVQHGIARTALENGGTIFRLHLTPPAEGADAIAIGYADHGVGVVLRVEASRVAGEERAALAVISSERVQPNPSAFLRRFHHHRHPFPEPFDI
jgi:hypothetical protein